MVTDQYLTYPSFLTHLHSLTLRISKTTGQQLVHLRVTQKQNQHILIANFLGFFICCYILCSSRRVGLTYKRLIFAENGGLEAWNFQLFLRQVNM
jgi:hypothetical protein